MLKKSRHFFILFCFLSFEIIAQNLDSTRTVSLKGEEYSSVVFTQGFSKDQIYSSLLNWVLSGFNTASSVMQLQDRSTGLMVLRGSIKIDATGNGISGTISEDQAGYVEFLCELKVKDGKYKYRFYSFKHTAARFKGGYLIDPVPDCGNEVMTWRTWQSIKDQLDDRIQEIIPTLTQCIGKYVDVQSEDW